MITPFQGRSATIGSGVFIDPSARIIGDIKIDEGASIWPMAVLRADSARIAVGRRSAVLDQALIEAPLGHPVIVNDDAIISHGAVIHGARVETNALVGIGAIVLEGAHIKSGSIVGAGSIVTAGTIVPENSLVLGTPGKVVRPTSSEERDLIRRQLEELYEKSREYLHNLGSVCS